MKMMMLEREQEIEALFCAEVIECCIDTWASSVIDYLLTTYPHHFLIPTCTSLEEEEDDKERSKSKSITGHNGQNVNTRLSIEVFDNGAVARLIESFPTPQNFNDGDDNNNNENQKEYDEEHEIKRMLENASIPPDEDETIRIRHKILNCLSALSRSRQDFFTTKTTKRAKRTTIDNSEVAAEEEEEEEEEDWRTSPPYSYVTRAIEIGSLPLFKAVTQGLQGLASPQRQRIRIWPRSENLKVLSYFLPYRDNRLPLFKHLLKNGYLSPNEGIFFPQSTNNHAQAEAQTVAEGGVEKEKVKEKEEEEEEDANGFRLLHCLVSGTNVNYVRFLVKECGADPFLCCGDGYDAVLLAIRDNSEEASSLEMVRFFVDENGCDPNHKAKDEYSLLKMSSYLGKTALVRYLIEEKKVSVDVSRTNPPPNGWTPIHVAAQEGSVGALRLLISHGAAVGPRSTDKKVWDHGVEDGATPLHSAARYNQIEAARILADSGCEMEAGDAEGLTALQAITGVAEFSNTLYDEIRNFLKSEQCF